MNLRRVTGRYDVEPVQRRDETAAVYRHFGGVEVGDQSPAMREWALGIAEDPEVLALIGTLPRLKQQPNLVIAAARWHGASGAYADLRHVLLVDWARVQETILARSTQTNEPGRCASMLPVLASIPGPLALIEVGASAGLCLYPDRYSYRYTDGSRRVALDPDDGPSPVVLTCEVSGDPPLPERLPAVTWRAGIDLNPLDVTDPDATAWLSTLVWPEHDERRARLRAAVEVARGEPAYVVKGDLNDVLPRVLAHVPREATPVVLHSAVIAYLDEVDRERFVTAMTGLVDGGRVRWVSNEGPRVLPSVTATAGAEPEGAQFVLGLDGRAVGWTHGHGRSLIWRGRADASRA